MTLMRRVMIDDDEEGKVGEWRNGGIDGNTEGKQRTDS